MSSENEIPGYPKKIIQVNEGIVKEQLNDVVRETVEETLNKMLDKEADELCEAQKYEHTAKRKSTRAGYYERGLDTSSGRVNLKVPKLRAVPFESAIIERYKRRECSGSLKCILPVYRCGVSRI